LAALERQVRAFAQGEHPDYDLMQSAVEYCLDFPDVCHHPKEDKVFSRLSVRDAGAAGEVGDLRAAHVKLNESLRSFAAALRAVVEDQEIPRASFVHRAEAFIELQRQHMAMEEARFFPAAEKALDGKDWQAVSAMPGQAKDPLNGRGGGERFDALQRDILAWEK
jgi:hemerythrin-like domain-containing protein